MTQNGFKFTVDDEQPDSNFQARRDAIRANKGQIDRLNRRITLISLLIPILFLSVIALGYLNIRKQFKQVHSSETMKVEKLSRELEDRFSALSDKFDKFDESMTSKVHPMDEIFLTLESTTTSLKDQLQKTRASIKKLEAAKAEKKVIRDELAKVNKGIESIHKTLDGLGTRVNTIDSLGTRMKTLDDRLAAEQAGLRAAIGKSDTDMAALREEIIGLLEKNPDKDTLESMFKEQESLFQDKVDVLMDNLKDKQRQIDSLRSHFRNLESALETLKENRVSRTPARKTTRKRVPPPSTQSVPAEAKKPAVQPSKPKTGGGVILQPGTIVEQDIN